MRAAKGNIWSICFNRKTTPRYILEYSNGQTENCSFLHILSHKNAFTKCDFFLAEWYIPFSKNYQTHNH